MKKTIFFLALILLVTSCSDDFLNSYPKARWTSYNYTNTDSIPIDILVEAKLVESYGDLRKFAFQWAGFGMCNYTTPDVEKGSTATDGGVIAEFKAMSYTPSNTQLQDYYSNCYSTIYTTNEAIALANSMSDTVSTKNTLLAEAIFIRSVMYYRLTQAFGGVPYVNQVLQQTENTPARSTRDEMWNYLETDLKWAIPHLKTRLINIANGTQGKATQNAARAVLAKVYMYQQKWSEAFTQTGLIISSNDNNLSTPYSEIWTEANEFNPESVFELNCQYKPDLQINSDMGSQFSQIQGIRGVPNMGWGFNAPSQVLMDAYETGDPRKEASVVTNGETLDDRVVKADAASYQYFNKKAYVHTNERSIYGRSAFAQGYWMNIRIIRYSDVLLMHAESACELENTTEALAKLEMVRERARNGNSTILPKVTTTDIEELRQKIRQERRIELAMEWERFFDLVRWGVAKDVIPNFVQNKHELFPIPQTEIDKSNGVLTQNIGY